MTMALCVAVCGFLAYWAATGMNVGTDVDGYRIDPESAGPERSDSAPRDRRLAPMPLVARALELQRRLLELKRQYPGRPVTQDQVQSLAVESL